MPAWGSLLEELQDHKSSDGRYISALSVDELRLKYLKQLSEFTGRNTIAYYSGWLNSRSHNVDINDSDMTGLMNAMKGLDCSKGLDLILHTPGGYPTAAEGMVNYLHSKFGNEIRVIVPQMAMSAGTMLACASKQIVMGKHSCLGPIDPQFNNVTAAYNIVNEFAQAKAELSKNPKDKIYWELQLNKYPVAFLYTVIDSINLSGVLTEQWLEKYMLTGDNKAEIANRIVGQLNANNKSHSRHFSYDFCKNLGLNVIALEDDQVLQENVLSVHHSFIITFDATKATKIIENQNGMRYVTRQQD